MRDPQYDFYATKDDDGLHLVVRSRGPYRMALAIALSIPTFFITVYGLFGLMAPTTGNNGVLPLVLGCVLGFVAYWLGNSRNSISIGINGKTLKTGSGSYDLDHITALNQSGPRIGGVIASGVYAGAAVVGQQMNQMIYIVYGSREIKLIEGQTLPSVQMIFSVLVGYLRTLGRQYGDADDTDVANYKATVQRGAAGISKPLPGWVNAAAAVVVVLGGIGFWAASERIKEVRARDAANEVTNKAAAEERRVAFETKDFEDGLRPELAGKYFIVGENTRLFKDPAAAPGDFFIKAGSCVKALKVSQRTIQFDVPVPDKFGVTRETTKLAPGGQCEPTRDPIRRWGR